MNQFKVAKIFFLSILNVLIFSIVSNAQVVDDSTKQVYGFHSTSVFTEKDVFSRNGKMSRPDSAVDFLYRYDKLYAPNYLAQNLGNRGTAYKFILPQFDTKIGYQAGYNVYDIYATDPSNIKYFNTHSPYANLNYIQGGTGENSLHFIFSRNITENWNFGLTVDRMTSVKQIGRKRQRDRALSGWDANFFTSFQSKNKKYTLLTNVGKFTHNVFESGGIAPNYSKNITDYDTSFSLYSQSAIQLTDSARSLEDRLYYHLFHQYDLKFAKLFNTFDYSNQYVGYNDKSLTGKPFVNIYPRYFKDSLTSFYRARFKTFENNIGLVGKVKGLDAKFFYTQKSIEYTQIRSTFSNKNNITQGFLNAQVAFNTSKDLSIVLDYKQMIANTITSDSSYKFNGSIDNKLLSVEVQWKSFKLDVVNKTYMPTLMQTAMLGNNYKWNNNLSSINNTGFKLSFVPKFKKQALGIYAEYQQYTNYTYLKNKLDTNTIKFTQDIEVKQVSDNINYLSLVINPDLSFGRFRFYNLLRYSKASNTALRMPTLYYNLLVSYTHKFKNAIAVSIGLDNHYKSEYYGDAYNPILQQFVVQNSFQNKAYLVSDLFINVNIKGTTVWVKGIQMNQGLFGQDVYFITPYYPGLKRMFSFGVNWTFFD
ncbi:MAG: hypothetical protein RLZZ175_2262 [Bacteroidota bacterium]|jgi:hypothetical protein